MKHRFDRVCRSLALAALSCCGAAGIAGCGFASMPGATPPRYPVLHYASSLDTMTHLDKDVLLHYAGEPAPGVAQVIVHGAKQGRGSSCEFAAINVLVDMQADAKKIGADAIINLRASWEGKDLYGEDGPTFDCQPDFKGRVFAVRWEGDFAVLAKQATQEAPPGEDEAIVD